MATEDRGIDIAALENYSEPSLDNQNDRTEISSSSKTSSPRLALITGMLMEKNKPIGDESDQDLIFDSDNQKNVASSALSRFGKSGLITGKRPAFSARSAADRSESSLTSVVTDADIRKFVFIHSRGKRFMNGLKVHSLNKQTFLSSFSVGVVLGIIVALVCKLLSEFVFSRTLMLSSAL